MTNSSSNLRIGWEKYVSLTQDLENTYKILLYKNVKEIRNANIKNLA